MKNKFFIPCVLFIAVSLLGGCAKNNADKSYKEDNLPELNIGIDGVYEPYTYTDENGDLTGIDIELAKEACERIGRKAVFIPIKWDNKDEYLKNGEVDCIWSCFTYTGREDKYLWAGPYMNSRQIVVVRKESDINNLDDLNGKTIAVMSSTKPEELLLDNDNGDLPKVERLYSVENMDIVFAMLRNEYVDAAACHEVVAAEYINEFPELYKILDESLLDAKVGVAFEKDGDKELADELTKALEEMRNDGTSKEILQKYGIDANKALEVKEFE